VNTVMKFRIPKKVGNLMKFSRAISRVKWLSGEQTNVSKTISVLVLRVLVLQMNLSFLGNFLTSFSTRLFYMDLVKLH
jgi:hypothetical protein